MKFAQRAPQMTPRARPRSEGSTGREISECFNCRHQRAHAQSSTDGSNDEAACSSCSGLGSVRLHAGRAAVAPGHQGYVWTAIQDDLRLTAVLYWIRFALSRHHPPIWIVCCGNTPLKQSFRAPDQPGRRRRPETRSGVMGKQRQPTPNGNWPRLAVRIRKYLSC